MQVIEVGPGPGGLTRAILDSNAVHLTAIEKDVRCIGALAPLAEHYPGRFTLLQHDALRTPVHEIGAAPRAVIANLPYNVGTQLVVNWLQEVAAHGAQVLAHFTVMLQKEVAQRMVAKPGDAAYGRLSVLLYQFCDANIMFDVPPGAFSPPPKVMSSVLHARILPQPREDVPLELLEQVVASAFNNRRKMLRQSLKTFHADAVGLCERAGIDPTLRAENCTLKMFADLVRAR
jgi:16S rRNA (adenine1518-N6/adenine1519-N6)-dimethyltransferase